MKKLVLALATVLMVSAAGSAFALSQTSTLPTTLTVNQTFTLTVATWKGGVAADRYDLVNATSINFGSFNIGQFTGGAPNVMVDGNQGGLILKGSTNNGLPWTLQIRDDAALTRQGGVETIPNSNFVFWGWKVAGEANGTVNFTTAQAISTTNQSIYTSTAGEGVTADTRIHVQFGVNVPAVRAGVYTNNVIITMTE